MSASSPTLLQGGGPCWLVWDRTQSGGIPSGLHKSSTWNGDPPVGRMRSQSIWELVSFAAVNVLFFLLVQTASVSSKSVFSIQWLPTIRNLNDVAYQFLGAGSSHDLSLELVRSYREWNERCLSELNDCLEMGNCAPNQSRVILVDARWFGGRETGWKGIGRRYVLILLSSQFLTCNYIGRDTKCRLYVLHSFRFPRSYNDTLCKVQTLPTVGVYDPFLQKFWFVLF